MRILHSSFKDFSKLAHLLLISAARHEMQLPRTSWRSMSIFLLQRLCQHPSFLQGTIGLPTLNPYAILARELCDEVESVAI